MAKNIVFVFHGIGQYQDGWMDLESCAVPILKAAAKDYPFFAGKSLDTFTEFVPILYDDVFERILKHWQDLAKGLKGAVPVLPAFAEEVIGLMEQAGEDKWSLKTGADVALYWGFKLFQQRVVLRVLAQITAKIASTITAADQTPHYHILAHSMGTAVAHDALHHLGTEAWLTAIQNAPLDDEDGEAAGKDRAAYLTSHARLREATHRHNPFSPEVFAFQSVTMLSNVTGLIHGAESPYHSIVRPGTPGDSGAFTNVYLNVNHAFDPISIVGKFRMPAGWVMGGNGIDISLKHVIDKIEHIHDAAHYVRHPDVHLRLLAQYVDQYVPSDDDVKKVANFDAKFSIDKLDQRATQALAALASGDTGPLAQLVTRLRGLTGLLEERP